MTLLTKLKTGSIVALALWGVSCGAFTASTFAAYTNTPKISFTFDDGFRSTRTLAAPILAAKGLRGTAYVTAGYIDSGVTGDDNLPAMTWAQVQQLQYVYNWEIGAHTETHPELPTISQASISAELDTSNAELLAHGIIPTNFASPFGAYDNKALIEILKRYDTHRGFADVGQNSLPYTRDILKVRQVNQGVAVATVKGYIDNAIANNTWLILVFHDVAAAKNPNYNYTTTTADLTEIATYVSTQSSKIKNVTVAEGAAVPGTQLLANSNFAAGFTNWTSDSTAVKLDTNNNGAYSDASNSAKLTGTTTAGHLFADIVNAVPGAHYLFEAFYNTTGLSAGELGFYIDEYDTNNNWISGQWLGKVANNAVGYFEKLYTATSNLVATLRVQTYLTANATGSAIVDNERLYNTDATPSATLVPTPTPTVDPSASPSATPSPSPIPVANSVPNHSFEQVSSGFATNWTRSLQSAFVLDTTSKGTDGTNSIHVVPQSTRAHLFSARIPVETGVTYTWKQDFTAGTATGLGEFGFYIDEYDVNSEWISGQWKGALYQPFVGTQTFTYVPTNANVKSIGLQYYTLENSGFDLYMDNVQLNPPTPVPTATPEPTPTPTVDPSATPSATPTPSPTATPSATPTATPVATPTPTPSPTATPSPIGANLVQNPSFEDVTGGFFAHWTSTLQSAFSADTTSQGTDGATSVHVTASATRAHLFSELIPVEYAPYTWNSYIKTSNAAGEYGFYIDEYDSTGNWLSGQWKGAVQSPFTGVKTFAYTPTSTNVKQVRLQYYMLENSAFNLFMDAVSFAKN